MSVWEWIAVVYLAFNICAAFFMIDRPRRSVFPGEALSVVLVSGFLLWVIVT